MSKTVKNLIAKAYKGEFDGVTDAIVIDIRGVDAADTSGIRGGFSKKSVKVRVIKNSLARKVFAGSDLESLTDFIDGPAAMVYSTSEDTSVVEMARDLIDWAKTVENLDLKGAVMDGMVFGPAEMKKLSEFPTKEEAQAKLVQIVLTPAQKLVGAVVAPGRNLAGIVKTIQEKLEAGETISKA
ncbi:MAG: 50S ribosomal protein L10 [Algisphaera sp.]